VWSGVHQGASVTCTHRTWRSIGSRPLKPSSSAEEGWVLIVVAGNVAILNCRQVFCKTMIVLWPAKRLRGKSAALRKLRWCPWTFRPHSCPDLGRLIPSVLVTSSQILHIQALQESYQLAPPKILLGLLLPPQHSQRRRALRVAPKRPRHAPAAPHHHDAAPLLPLALVVAHQQL